MRTSDVLLWTESLPRLPGYSCVGSRTATPLRYILRAPLQQLWRMRLNRSLELSETLMIGVQTLPIEASNSHSFITGSGTV